MLKQACWGTADASCILYEELLVKSIVIRSTGFETEIWGMESWLVSFLCCRLETRSSRLYVKAGKVMIEGLRDSSHE